MSKRSAHKMNRRRFMKSVAGAAAAGAAATSLLNASCGDSGSRPNYVGGGGDGGNGGDSGSRGGGKAYDTPPEKAPAGKELRELQFHLPHSNLDNEHYVVVWGKRYKLEAHTAETRAALATRSRHHDAYVAARPPTHYSAPLPFPDDALQYILVYHTSPRHKLPQLALGSLHIPAKHLKAHYDRAVAGIDKADDAREYLMHAHRRAAIGLKQSLPDYDSFSALADAHDISSAATWVCFHHPELATVDPGVATKVLGYLDNAGGMQDLEAAIGELGAATDPDESGEYEGWANGFYQTDQFDNQIVTDDGINIWQVQVDDYVKDAAGPVVIAALNLVRNDPDLLNVRYGIQPGRHADVIGGDDKQAGGTTCSGTGYALDHGDQWRGGVNVTKNSVDADGTVHMTVRNSYFRFLGVYVAFRDAAGNIISMHDATAGGTGFAVNGTTASTSDGDFGNFKWIANMRDIPRILGIPLEDHESLDFTVKFPQAASRMEVLAGALAYRYLSEDAANDTDDYNQLRHGTSVATGIIDLMLPSIGLAAGVGGLALARLKMNVAEMLLNFFAFAVVAAAGSGALAGSRTDYGAGQFAIIKICWWFLTMVGNVAYMAGAFDSLVAAMKSSSIYTWIMKQFSETAGETAAEESVPIFGQILYAINIAGSVAELAETMTDLGLSSPVQKHVVSRSHDIHLTVAHDENDTQFPAVATKVRVSATFSGSNCVTIPDRPLAPTDLLAPNMTFDICGVPEGGSVTFTVHYLTDNNWLAGQATGTFTNLTPAGATRQEISLRITENLVPLDATSHYASSMKLTYASGRRQWQNDSSNPTGTISARSCAAGANSLCEATSLTVSSKYGQLGYTWESAAPAFAGCGGNGPAGTLLYQAMNVNFSGDISTGDPEALLMRESCGSTQPRYLAYDLKGDANGRHFILDTSTGKAHLRRIALTNGGSYATKSYGTFTTASVKAFAIHEAAYVCALNASGNKIEILQLPESPFDTDALAEQYLATQVAGPGRNFGNVLGCVAIAPTKDGSSFIVLENTNRRLQCFSRFGQPVTDFFADPSNAGSRLATANLHDYVAPGSAAAVNVTYVDLPVESTGYLYVLGYYNTGAAVSDYFLDIHKPDGSWLARTGNFAAARMAVDLWRSVWSLDWAHYVTTDGRTEPVVRRWIPSTPAGNG